MSENRPLAEYPLVLGEWIDASRISDSWIDMADVPTAIPHTCVSVGFLISENDQGKILVPTVADIEHPENRHTYGGMLIPGAAIIPVKKLMVSGV
jgi:hypothetical protein